MVFGAKADEVIARDLGLMGEDNFDEKLPQQGGGSNPLHIVERHLEPLSRRQLKALMFIYFQDGDEWKEVIDFFLKIRTLQGGDRDLLIALENMKGQQKEPRQPSLFNRRREI